MVGPSITVVAATLGRTFLPVMVASHWATARPGDRLILLGDGVERPPCDLPDWVEWRSLPKAESGVCGHLHIFNALNAGVPGDYIALMGDDDVWVPEAFTLLRWALKKYRTEMVWYPTTRGMWMTKGRNRLLFPNQKPFPIFGPGHRSDGEFFIGVSKGKSQVFIKQLIMIGRACFLKEAEWEKVGLNEIYPWAPWFETTRSREDEWPSGMPPGFQSVPKT